MAYISRDPFAREEVHRERKYAHQDFNVANGCKWCGNKRSTENGRLFLYQYRVEQDGGRKSDVPGLFCSIDCCRSYSH